MPLLNPGIVVDSPFLSDDFMVTRQKQTINTKGRAEIETPEHCKAFGIVTQAKQRDIESLPDLRTDQNVISIVTRHVLRVNTPGYQPDVVTWAGTSYLVRAIKAYPRFGQGWYIALAVSQNAVDIMPEKCDGN